MTIFLMRLSPRLWVIVCAGTLRGSSFLLGSDWDYAGFNLAGAYYLPMSRNERLAGCFLSRYLR